MAIGDRIAKRIAERLLKRKREREGQKQFAKTTEELRAKERARAQAAPPARAPTPTPIPPPTQQPSDAARLEKIKQQIRAKRPPPPTRAPEPKKRRDFTKALRRPVAFQAIKYIKKKRQEPQKEFARISEKLRAKDREDREIERLARAELARQKALEVPKIACPHCGSGVMSNLKHCPFCQNLLKAPPKPVPGEARCPYCTEKIDPKWDNCKHCKSPLKVKISKEKELVKSLSKIAEQEIEKYFKKK
jgi:hypothetical protein